MAEERHTNPVLSAITKNSDIILALSVVGILVLMVIPIPTWTLDIFLTLSISMALVVLMVTMYIVRPLDFAVFPGMLLILTLFRLALNVSSTRLILGQAFAGRVIEAFGSFVVKGNYVVGFVIFLILVLINFLVIVKGAGRIAEVAARFTLDAMPGKQMAIDADLNAGIINEVDARERRAEISREAEFYGAMDGASKFVKGDAIAGLIIAAINILGGLIIGVAQKGMSFSDAVQTYTLLTIGDGLVSQIPALIISTSAGIIVTRAATEENLGKDLQKQIFAQPKALFVASGALLFFGITPGLPMFPFFILSVMIGIMGFLGLQAEKEKKMLVREEEVPLEEVEDRIESYLQVDPMELEIGYGLIPIVDVEQDGDLLNRITTMRKQIAMEMGFIVPPIRIRDNIQLNANDYVIKIRGVEIAKGFVLMGSYLAMNPGAATEKLEGEETIEPAFGLKAYWISEAQREKAELAGYTVVEASAVVATHLMEVIKANGDKILGRQDTQTLIDNIKNNYPAVVEELIPGLLSLGQIQKVLQNLLKERIPIRDLVTILETLSDYAQVTKDPDILTEYVRQALSITITRTYQSEEGVIHTLTLDPRVEQIISEALAQAKQKGGSFAIPPEAVQKLYQSISKRVEELTEQGLTPIIVCSQNVRMYFRRLIESIFPNVAVLSYNELIPTIKIESIGGVSLENED